MAWLNIIAILILQKPALIALKDYEAQKRAGRDPTFDPVALGIRNAHIWEASSKSGGPGHTPLAVDIVADPQPPG